MTLETFYLFIAINAKIQATCSIHSHAVTVYNTNTCIFIFTRFSS